MRPIWSGFIGFGLVNIPVKLYSPTAEREIDLDYLHEKDLSPVRYARICRVEEKEIPFDEIVRGAKHGTSHVVLDDEDFKKANVRKTSTIEIEQFATAEEIDAIYFEKPYYLEPETGSEKPYRLFREALKRSKKVGLAKFVLRSREHLAAIRPSGNVLVLNQMRFSSDLQEPDDLSLPKDGEVSAKELKMAVDLIGKLTAKFAPDAFKDTYGRELRHIIRQKARGVAVKPRGIRPTATHVDDLMSTLKQSLAHQSGRR